MHANPDSMKIDNLHFVAMLQTAWKTPKDFRLLFHCFSNTGWYTFGAVMEGLLKHAAMLLQHVIGSVVDSAPHAEVSLLQAR